MIFNYSLPYQFSLLDLNEDLAITKRIQSKNVDYDQDMTPRGCFLVGLTKGARYTYSVSICGQKVLERKGGDCVVLLDIGSQRL